MDNYVKPSYQLSEQIYESSDKKIRIFKTRKRTTIEYIAVKVYTKKQYDQYNLEVNIYSILKSFNNPNIVKCVGFAEDYNYFYMELEYCITGDLSRCIWQNKHALYPEKIVNSIGYQLFTALHSIHKSGLLHCNLKPSNILIDEFGNIRICDFKKSLKVQNKNMNEIRKNKAAMTPCYTAPELFSEDGIYSFKTEFWALGCILYELATGQVPFFDENIAKLINKIINEEINFHKKEFNNFSNDFIDLLKKLLEKDPTKRISWSELVHHNFWENSFPDTTWDLTPGSPDRNSSRGDTNIQTITDRNLSSARNNREITQMNISSNKDVNTTKLTNNTDNKKNDDIMRLSRIAIKHMKENDDDEYSKEKQKEVEGADQEFNFEDEKKNDEQDQEKGDSDIPFEKLIKINSNNPLDISVLNVSRIMTRDKRRDVSNPQADLEKSIANFQIPPLESVIIHPSDKIIKPIIGNKAIEIITPTTYNKNKLSFVPWRMDKIKEIFCRNTDLNKMEKYLLLLYTLMEQHYSRIKDPVEEDNLLNILNYFETIIQDKEIANNIINTSFTPFFINMLAGVKAELIRIRLCSIIAFLIRYSTVIDTPLDNFNLCKVLDTCVQSKNVDLSRKGIATLGEYLFFVATQAEGEEQTASNWFITEDSIITLLSAVDSSRDDIVKFYATKTVENITALTMISKKYFATNDKFISKFIDSYNTAKNIELKTSIIYTISHLIRLEPKLFRVLIVKKDLVEITKNIEEESIKNQQALINCVLFGIKEDNSLLIKNENLIIFLSYITNLLESGINLVVKMKIIMIFALVLDNTSVIAKCGSRLFTILSKLRKDTSSDLHQIIKVFESIVKTKIRTIIKLFISQLTSYLSNKNSKSYDEVNLSFSAFNAISSYSKLTSSLFSIEILDFLVKMIDKNDIISDETLRKNIFATLQCFSENQQAVHENCEYVLKKLVVPVMNSSLNSNVDNKILPLNIIANIITALIDDDKLYSSTVLDSGKTKLINAMIIQILPILSQLLKIDELIYSILSFLSLVLERNSAFIKYFKSEGLITYLLSLSKDTTFCTNLNLIKIVIKLIESADTSFDELISSWNIIEYVNKLISSDQGENSILTEYIIEMFFDLMQKINEQKKLLSSNKDKFDVNECKKFTEKVEDVGQNFKMCIKLLANDNINIQDKSCVALTYLLQLLGDTYIDKLKIFIRFTITDIPDLLKGLENSSAKIHKRVIRIFRWIIEYQSDAQKILKQYIPWIKALVENIIDSTPENDVRTESIIRKMIDELNILNNKP